MPDPVLALEKLRNHLWPGNVRELKNVVYRLKTLYNRLNYYKMI